MSGKREPSRDEQMQRARAIKRRVEERDELIARKTGRILLVTMGIAIAVPMLWRGQAMQRNTYRSLADCERDYSVAQCEPGGEYRSDYTGTAYRPVYGPWYPEDPAARKPGEAGRNDGRRSALADRGGFVGTEPGVRGGFGSTGRVRAIGT